MVTCPFCQEDLKMSAIMFGQIIAWIEQHSDPETKREILLTCAIFPHIYGEKDHAVLFDTEELRHAALLRLRNSYKIEPAKLYAQVLNFARARYGTT